MSMAGLREDGRRVTMPLLLDVKPFAATRF
jgi:hypothetical protein